LVLAKPKLTECNGRGGDNNVFGLLRLGLLQHKVTPPHVISKNPFIVIININGSSTATT
jgi:hypothetical protein